MYEGLGVGSLHLVGVDVGLENRTKTASSILEGVDVLVSGMMIPKAVLIQGSADKQAPDLTFTNTGLELNPLRPSNQDFET